jgi:Lysozyme like domain
MATATAGSSVVRPQHYTFDQLKQLWVDAGGDQKHAPLMAAIALAESGGRPQATNKNKNGSIDRGLWQINSSHGWGASSFDPRANARQAVTVLRAQGPKAWSAFTNGSWAKFFPGATTQPQAGGLGGTLGGIGGALGDAWRWGNRPVGDIVPGVPSPSDIGDWVDRLTGWAEQKGALILLYLTFTGLAVAFLVLGTARAAGVSSLGRGPYRPPNLQSDKVPF